MDSNQKVARTAGAVYLVVVVTGILSQLYIPSQIIVRGDALATVTNIQASESLYRLGIVVGALASLAFLLLPLVLYKLLHRVNESAAVLMVALAAMNAPLSFVSLANKLHVLSLLGGADYLNEFTTEQLNALVMLSLRASNSLTLVSETFWGLWLFPFGYLVFRSGFLPKVLGVLLMIGCFSYLSESLGTMLFPGYAPSGAAWYLILLPSILGEVGICLWLLIMGARTPARGAA